MEGYEVITSDEHKAGRVVEVKGDSLIVEHGLLRKTRRARIREGKSEAGRHGRPIIPPDPHEGP